MPKREMLVKPTRSCLAIRILTVLVALCVRPPANQAQEFPREPLLRIETGRHTAVIRAIDSDRAGRWLVTASEDKTVRVWDAATGQMERVLRPPIGNGDDGKLYAVAISPDGRLVACGGWTGQLHDREVYLFLRTNGRLVGRSEGLPNVIYHLAFSPDGRMLVATLAGTNGVRVFAINEGGNLSTGGSGRITLGLIAEDDNYRDDSYGADFFHGHKGLVTASLDGFLRLYDLAQISAGSRASRAISPRATAKAPGGSRPFSVKVSPDDSRVAIGFGDGTAVAVVSGRDLRLAYTPDTRGVTSGNLGHVAWSNDGRFLFAGGDYRGQTGAGRTQQHPVRRWASGGQGASVDLPTGMTDTIMDLAPLADGSLAVASVDPAIDLLKPDGRSKWFVGPNNADFRDGNLLLSQDGSRIAFRYSPSGEDLATFSIADRSLTVARASASLFPFPTIAGLDVESWKDTPAPTLNGHRLPLENHEISRSLAVAPDGKSFLLGTEFWLRHFDRDGKEVWKVAVPGVTWSVKVAGNGNVAAAAFADGSIHWYRYSDGKELAAFFPHADRKRWALWTPSGYYDASPGGEELFGWHVNNGPDQAADFYPASRFRSTKYRPDVVARVLTTLNEADAVRLADAERGKAPETITIAQALPPVITVTSPDDRSPVSSTTVTLHYAVRTPSGEPVTGIRALVDGRPAAVNQGGNQAAKQGADQTITITIPPQDCQVSLIAENRFSASVPSTVRLTWVNTSAPATTVSTRVPPVPVSASAPAASVSTSVPATSRGVPEPRGVTAVPSAGTEFVVKPKLYLLAVGESAYQKPGLKLAFAAKDARDFAAAMQAQKGGLYRDVEVKLLPDSVKDQIEDGLDWLQHQVTSHDVGMIFLAGHGVDDSTGVYYFLPANADLDALKRTGLVFSDIKTTMESIAGKAVMFVDTCHSGNVMGSRRGGPVDINAVVNELAAAENGVVVFAASTGRQFSLEDPQWQNGAFTKALVEGIDGKADYEHNGRITVNMLDLYVSERVKELTKGQQTPSTTKPSTVPDFPLAYTR